MGSAAGWVLLGLILLPVVLQGIGIFGSEWIKSDSCLSTNPKRSCCNKTDFNISGCGSSFKLADLDAAVFNIESASFAIFILPILCFFLELFFNKAEDTGCCGALGGVTFLLYPIAGLLSFVGCMVILAKYSGQTPGSSFYYCLGCGLYVLVVTGISICILCYNCKHKQDEKYNDDDPETGRFVGFFVRVNIIHIAIHHN